MEFLLLFISFDMDPVCFKIPFVGHPIAWYGVIFSGAFYIGYKIFIWLHVRYALDKIVIPQEFATEKVPKDFVLDKKQQKLFNFYCARISAKDKQEKLLLRFYLEQKELMPKLSAKSTSFADSGLLYIILATVIGARLAHILFYQNIMEYLASPILIIKTWEGGLASHGGIAAILLAAFLFVRKKKTMGFFTFMDLMTIPTMFVCAWIRIGNFINQEILGSPTSLPWAIIFQHPATGAPPIPRHPIQLYEFILYLSVSLVLFILWRKNVYKYLTGLYTGLAITISFTVRFFLEFLKLQQSIHDNGSGVQVSQLLSLPMCIVGVCVIIFALKNKEALDKKASEH